MAGAFAVTAGAGKAAVLTPDGELLTLGLREAAALVRHEAPVLIHAPATLRRLGLPPTTPARDILELFLLACPARPAAPTAGGLARALDMAVPCGLEAEAAFLPDCAAALLHLVRDARHAPSGAALPGLVARLRRAGWAWGEAAAHALNGAGPDDSAFRVWRRLPALEPAPPPPPPAQHPVASHEARARLARLLGPAAEQRPTQADYAHAAATAFQPRESAGDPRVVLAEAGTGTGKTLGYLAPASLWAERNGAPVWISTYTKHLQRQIEGELARLHPDPSQRRARAVVRKGRENYLCLLNFEEAVSMALTTTGSAGIVPLALLVRWIEATADGDVAGGDLPGWFTELFGPAAARLTDRRGECLHGACTHVRRCFVEATLARARQADLVIANHALVMAQAAWGGLDGDAVPTRYVFDEGHLLFEAADGAFAAEISGREGTELRRWLLGREGAAGRSRGLERRLDDLVVGHPELEAPLQALLTAARVLPAGRFITSEGPFARFLAAVRDQVLARAPDAEDPRAGAIECDLHPVTPALAEAAPALRRALARILEPCETLIARFAAHVEDHAEALDTAARDRIDLARRGLATRVRDPLRAWIAMLDTVERLATDAPEPGVRPDYVHILKLDRHEGADRDAAYARHHLDPTLPFALTLARPAHGLLVTSATLRDSGAADADAEADWAAAEARSGAAHLPSPAFRAALASPFDYAAQTRCIIVTDVGRTIEDLAGAYRALFEAAGGGALGLFTAIARLRAVHARIAEPLEGAGLRLLAQHVDPMDNATLVDILRTEENACLLGTDAMRDGVDVPGRALRLVVFERVPWPRPDILHRERRLHLSGGAPAAYDDRIARLRLRQAFGRLIRTRTDQGVFVLLDRRTPTRLLPAFPAGVRVQRLGLQAAVAETSGFLATAGQAAPVNR